MKRSIIYARVSTRDQNIEIQLSDLRSYAKTRGFTIVLEYIDYGSGSQNDRVEYLKMLDDVHKRKCDFILVWKFDRFARSTKELINALEEFKVLGVDFISYKENIDTSTPAGKALFTLISAFAEFEREILVERVRSGMQKAKAEGKHIGRPRKITAKQRKTVEQLTQQGFSYTEILKKIGISKSSYYNIMKG